MNEVYEWTITWVLYHLDYIDTPEPDDIMRITEETLRDYDMKNPDVLSDNEWDDLFVGVTDTLISRYGLTEQVEIPIDFQSIPPYYKDSIQGEHLTKQENLKLIMESMPEGTNEIVHVVLKSQIKSKAKRPGLSRNVQVEILIGIGHSMPYYKDSINQRYYEPNSYFHPISP